MLLTDYFSLTLGSLKNNLGRSTLALVGLGVGVAALVGVISLGRLTGLQVSDSMSNVAAVTVLKAELVDPDERGHAAARLTPALAAELVREVPNVIDAAPEAYAWAVGVEAGPGAYAPGNVYGVTPNYFQVMGLDLKAGRYLTERDLAVRSHLALIGRDLAEELFGTDNPVGRRVLAAGSAYTIVGALNPTVWEPGGTGLFIPLPTAQRRIPPASRIQIIRIRAANMDCLEQVKTDAEKFFDRRRIWPEIRVTYSRAAVKDIRSLITLLKVFFAAVSALTLALGSVGLMNTLLASLAERTREIGLRRAVGASQSDIFHQFLGEAAALALTGALLGLALGNGLLYFGGQLLRVDPTYLTLDPALAVLVVLGGAVLGSIFAVGPVWRASRLDLVQALRYY